MNILITGASSGIGQALALHYAALNHTLYLTGRDEARLAKVAETCRALGAKITTAAIDVCDEKALRSFIEQADDATPLDLVIANAGIGLTDDKSPTPESLSLARRTFNVNCTGVLNTLDPILPRMAARKSGHIALMASLAGYVGLPSAPMYAATKNFVRAYGDGLLGSLHPYNIKVSVICPGFVESRITDQNTCPMPFFMKANKAAKIIAHGLAQNKACIAFPWPMILGVWVLSILPSYIRSRLARLLPAKTDV